MKRSYKDTERRIGNPVERLACPMCGWIRTMRYGKDQRTGEPREVRFDKMDVEHAPIWRLEKLSGRGHASHDAVIELVDSKTLAQLPDEYKIQIKIQCQKILSIL